MEAAYGLYTHIRSNRRRSVILLICLFAFVYLLVYAGALAGEALSTDASLEWLLRRAWLDFLAALPWATGGTLLWILIAYRFHQWIIDAVTGGRTVTRQEQPRLYNLLENLCISRGITMPKLKVMESQALNAFATGIEEKQYAITVTTGLSSHLNDAEIGPRAHAHPQRRCPAHGHRRYYCGRDCVLCRVALPHALPFGFRLERPAFARQR
jgi:heat shock protein HtpX